MVQNIVKSKKLNIKGYCRFPEGKAKKDKNESCKVSPERKGRFKFIDSKKIFGSILSFDNYKDNNTVNEGNKESLFDIKNKCKIKYLIYFYFSLSR